MGKGRARGSIAVVVGSIAVVVANCIMAAFINKSSGRCLLLGYGLIR